MSQLFTTQDLFDRLAKSDKDAFEAIYKHYWNELYQAAYSRLRDDGQARDLIQDIFIRLWERRTALKIQNLGAYLHTAVRYQVYNYVSRNEAPETFYEPFHAIARYATAADAPIIEKELHQLVQAYLLTLPPKKRRIFTLYTDENLDTKEIANRLNISRKTVQNQLGSAIAGLKAHILPLLILVMLLSAQRLGL